MPDILVTVPKKFTHPAAPGKVGLTAWLGEGDAPGTPWSGIEWAFSISAWPDIQSGERVYVCCNGRLVGYAPLVRIEMDGKRVLLIRHGGAVACTIDEMIVGFMGFRYRWWERDQEKAIDLAEFLD